MNIQDCNPYVRAAQIQPAVLEGAGARMAYDHRLFYILEGEGTLVLTDRTVALAPDTLLLWRPGVGYHFRGRLRVAVLNFDMTRKATRHTVPICPPPADEFDPTEIFDSASTAELCLPLIRPDSGHLRDDVLALIHAFSESDPLSDAMTSGLLKKLLAMLFRAERQGKDVSEELVERVRRYIRLYAAEIEGNGTVGQAFGYHPVYIATLFRERTGETLHHAILSERIALARRWLTLTDRSIEEIALDTGFSSRSHFCTAFKSFTGCTPRSYRAQRQ